MQKIADQSQIVSTSTGVGVPNIPGLSPETLDLVAPLAAMALMSYGGYALANKLSDRRAQREREDRLKENMNKLERYNLERLALSRGMVPKQADEKSSIIGTMFNPFQGMAGMPGGSVYVPKWFNVSGSETPGQLEKVLAKTIMLGGTYGTMAFGMKYLMNALERKKEEQEGSKGIQSAVKAALPIVSPDPYLSDLKEEEKREAMGLEEEQAYDEALEKTADDDFWTGLAAKLRYGGGDKRKGSLTASAKAVLALAAIGSFGAGAVLTKRWADDRDENRKRIKAAEKAARMRAIQETPPTLISDIDPDIEKQLDAHIRGGALKIKPRSVALPSAGSAAQLTNGTLEEQEIDPSDSFAQNIAVV